MKNKILLAFMVLPILVQAESLKYTKTDHNFKDYQGRITLAGSYSRILDPETLDYMGDAICFEPTKKSSTLIPRPKGDTRVVWFCFSNFNVAKKIFKLPDNIKKGYCKYEGQATIQIKDYKLFIEITDGFDLTHLISAKNITPAKAIKCEAEQ